MTSDLVGGGQCCINYNRITHTQQPDKTEL